LATTPSVGATSTAALRFGFRADAALAPGTYRAPIAFEVLAPSTL
jgi:hypothetical protein